MIINIDTSKESAKQLKQVASFLVSLADEKTDTTYQEPDVVADSQASTAAFDMFDMSSDAPSQVDKKPPADDSDDGFRMIPY